MTTASITPHSRAVAARPTSAAAGRPAASKLGAAVDPIKVLRQHWLVLAILAMVGGGLGLGGYVLADLYFPRYAGKVTFELIPQLRNPLETAAGTGEPGDAVLRAMRTEAEYLISADILGRTLRESKDVRDRTAWGARFIDADGNFAYDDAVKDLKQRLTTIVGRDINLFAIEWSTEKAADVPVVLNAVSETYIDFRTRRDDLQYQGVLQQFEDRVADLDRRIKEGQNLQDQFIVDNNLTDLETAQNTQLRQKAADLLQSINDATKDQQMAESIRQQVDEKLRGVTDFNHDDRRMAEDDPNIRSMRTMLNNQRMFAASVVDKFGPGHGEVLDSQRSVKAAEGEYEIAVRQRIRQDLDARMSEAILEAQRKAELRKSLEEEYAKTERRLRDVQALIARFKDQDRVIKNMENDRVELNKFIRDLRLMKSRDDARRVRVAFPAETPKEKSFPSLPMFVGLGTFLALALTGGLIFLREFLDQRVKGSNDIAAIPGARVLGIIPDLEDDPTNCEHAELVVSERPQSVLAESYRQASVPIMEALGTDGGKVLLVLGGMPGAGTTTVISNLAAVEEAAGRRVLVLDANFRRPGVARVYSAPEDAQGLGDLLGGKVALDECLIRCSHGPDLLVAGTPASRICERLQTTALDSLLNELRERYDVILVDSPPAVVAGESMILARKADAVVLVVRARQEERGLVARLVRQLSDLRGEFLGVILNRPRGTAGGYLRKNYATIAEYARPAA
jgi:capsular exopolysaccharide synthesis family protein